MLAEEQPHLRKLPERSRLAPYLREDRLVARDGFVSWEASRYGVDWKWVGATVQVGQRQGTVEIWASQERLAVPPRSQEPGQRFTLPGQWEGCPKPTGDRIKRHWRCRSRWVRWSAAPWRSTSWPLREVCDDDDRPGTSLPAPGDPGPQAGR